MNERKFSQPKSTRTFVESKFSNNYLPMSKVSSQKNKKTGHKVRSKSKKVL